MERVDTPRIKKAEPRSDLMIPPIALTTGEFGRLGVYGSSRNASAWLRLCSSNLFRARSTSKGSRIS